MQVVHGVFAGADEARVQVDRRRGSREVPYAADVPVTHHYGVELLADSREDCLVLEVVANRGGQGRHERGAALVAVAVFQLPCLVTDLCEQDGGIPEDDGDVVVGIVVLALDERVQDVFVVLDALVLELVLLGGAGMVADHAVDADFLVASLVGIDETGDELVVLGNALRDGCLVVLAEFVMDVAGEHIAKHEYVEFLAPERLRVFVVLLEELDMALLRNFEVVFVEAVHVVRLNDFSPVDIGQREDVVELALAVPRGDFLDLDCELVRGAIFQCGTEFGNHAALLVVGSLHVLYSTLGCV